MKLSVGTQLAAVTVAVLTLVTTLLVVVLAAQERDREIAVKRTSAGMVTDLFAASVSAGVVFGDNDAVQAVLSNLRRTEDVVGAAVYTPSSTAPIGSFGPALPPPDHIGVEASETQLVIIRDVRDNADRIVGRAIVAFSLARENANAARSRRHLALAGLVAMLVTAMLLIWSTRSRVVQPLMRLVAAAKEVEDGGLRNRASEYGNAEISTLARAFNEMADTVASRERALKDELQVAADLQLSILPKHDIVGIETAAMMKPATEVGGDYYDIIPSPDGCWIGIGDVSGHGLGAGVIMLMIQSSIAAMVSANPRVSPAVVDCVVNKVLYENIRQRMGRRDHATLSIFRYTHDGQVRFAGAHEEIIVYRAATGEVETIETPGTWVGARNEIAESTMESSFQLEPNDVLVLYTDGITEAMQNGKQLGFDRLCEVVQGAASGSAHDVRDAILAMVAEWTANPADDVSVVVLKQSSRISGERTLSTDVLKTGTA